MPSTVKSLESLQIEKIKKILHGKIIDATFKSFEISTLNIPEKDLNRLSETFFKVVSGIDREFERLLSVSNKTVFDGKKKTLEIRQIEYRINEGITWMLKQIQVTREKYWDNWIEPDYPTTERIDKKQKNKKKAW